MENIRETDNGKLMKLKNDIAKSKLEEVQLLLTSHATFAHISPSS